MKKPSSYFLIVILVFGIACQNSVTTNNPYCVLTKSDSLTVIKKVLEITDDFAEANNKFDYERLVECWAYDHPNFIAIENLDLIKPDGLYERVKTFYTNTELETTNLEWKKREIIPLSKSSAHMYGEYEIFFKYKNKEGVKLYDEGIYYVNYSALITETDGIWKVIRFHESYKKVD